MLIPFVRTRIGFLFTQDFIDANTNGGRGGRWPLGLELLQAYGVWTGVGHGMFGGAVAMQNQVLDYVQYFYLDNYYLKTLVETGYLGLAGFIIMLLGMIAASCRSICRTGKQWKSQVKTGIIHSCAACSVAFSACWCTASLKIFSKNRI